MLRVELTAGMFTILVPVIAAPIIATIWWGSRPDVHQRARLQAAKERRLRSRPRAVERAETIDMLCARREGATPLQQRWIDMQLSYHSFDLAGSSHRSWVSLKSIFWQLDFIGLVLFVIGFGLFFVTITTANSRTARWSDAHSIAQLVVGAVAIVAFIVWERVWAPHPLLPFALLRRKTVIGCVLIALFSPMSGRIIGQYLYTFLIVAAGVSPLQPARTSLTRAEIHQDRDQHHHLAERCGCLRRHRRIPSRRAAPNAQMVLGRRVLPPDARHGAHDTIPNIDQFECRAVHRTDHSRNG